MFNDKYHSEDLSRYNFLVTGGAGFIGSNFVTYLLKHGAKKVRILDNLSTGFERNLEKFVSNPSIEIVKGDIGDYNVCQKAMEEIDFVSHQAALGSVPRSIKDPVNSNHSNVTGFLNILTAAKNAPVKRMVYASSSSVYGDSPTLPKKEDQIGNPLSPYAITKYVNELYADIFSKIYGFHTIGMRYFNVFGPNQSPEGPYAAVIPLFIEAAIKQEQPYINGDGTTSRDFTFIENVIQANIKALFTPELNQHEAVNIAYGDRTTLNELWLLIADEMRVDIKPTYKDERAGDIKHSLADISKAKKLFGYNPLYNIKKGIEITCSWYKNN